MPLKIFNATNTSSPGGKKAKVPTIRVSIKSGLMCLNKPAAELIQGEAGTQLEFAQDDSNKIKWFLRTVSENGLQVRQAKHALCFNNSFLAKEIASSFPRLDSKSVTIKFTGETMIKIGGVGYWSLELAENQKTKK